MVSIKYFYNVFLIFIFSVFLKCQNLEMIPYLLPDSVLIVDFFLVTIAFFIMVNPFKTKKAL